MLYAPTLTIGIPVFNGAEDLVSTLASVERLKEFKSGALEVLISDNNSTDGSFVVAKSFEKNHPRLVTVVKNDANKFLRGNLLNLTRIARTRHVWFLGAGERVAVESLQPLLAFLQGEVGSSTFAGVLATTGLNSNQVPEAHPSWKIRVNLPHTASCFSETISLIVVNRELALEVLAAGGDPAPLEASFWPHLEIALEASRCSTFQILSPPLVTIAPNPGGWWYHGELAMPIYTKQLQLLRSSLEKTRRYLGARNRNWWAEKLASNKSGWQFAAFVFEITLNGKGAKFRDLILARKEGAKLGPFLTALIITQIPKIFLSWLQALKRNLMP
jgi:glycosyltransferase involved in cell wall biosynthesis